MQMRTKQVMQRTDSWLFWHRKVNMAKKSGRLKQRERIESTSLPKNCWK